MLRRSTVQHLRFPFSFLLMPVFLLALLSIETVNLIHTVVLWVILHLFIFPASNGYNSFQDQDTDSIGGVERPLPVTKELYRVSVLFEVAGMLMALFLGLYEVLALGVYIICSHLYSWRKVRLKKYPILSFFVVVLNQGALIFALTTYTCSLPKTLDVSVYGGLAAVLLLASSYPISQVYQHGQDKRDGVKTMSMLLGVKGTFLFSGLGYLCAGVLLLKYISHSMGALYFIVVVLGFAPFVFKMIKWFLQSLKNPSAVNFKNTMSLNITAAICANVTFTILLMIKHFG